MRLLSLELEKYGAFSGRVLNFRPDARAHIVFGVNEAGKSTALAAVTDLLFGIDDMRQAFLHGGPGLRIRGEIISKDRKSLKFTRRKGNKPKLLDSTGAALPDDALAPWLGGLTRPIFRRAFGLTCRDLREGADELLKSGGDVGESLMAAASGLRGLSDLRRTLETEASAIFTPRYSERRTFYQAKDAHKAANKSIRERELLSGDWQDLLRQIATCAERLDAIRESRLDIATRLARVDRLRKLKPLLAALDAATAELAPHNDVTDLPRDFGKNLGDGLAMFTAAERVHVEATRNLEAASAELASINVDRALLARGSEIAAIYRDLGAYRKALVDRPRVQSEADGYHADATRLAADLGFGDVDGLASRQPTVAMLAEINRLIREGESLENRRRQIEDSLDVERERLAKLDRQGEARGVLVEPGPLREKYMAFGDVAALVKERDREAWRIETEEQVLVHEAARLSPSVLDLAKLAPAILPCAEAITAFRQEFDFQERELSDSKAALDAARDEVTRVEARLRGLAGDRPVPSAERIADARAKRDREWPLIRATLFSESEALSGAALAASVASFETTSANADRLADDATRDAERVSAHRAAVADLARCQSRERRARENHDVIETKSEGDGKRWKALWLPVEIEPRSPRDMTTWLTSVLTLLERLGKLTLARDIPKRMDLELAALLPGLENLAADTGLPPIEGLDASRIAARISERLKTIERTWSAARDENTRRNDARTRIEERQTDLQKLAPALRDWEQAWREATSQLGLSGATSRDAARAALDAWKQAPGALDSRKNRLERVNGMTRDIERFELGAEELVETLATDLARLSAADAVEALHGRLAAASAEAGRYDSATKRKLELETALARAANVLGGAKTDLAALSTFAPVDADLAALKQRLDERDAARGALDKARSDFRLVADGHAEDAVRDDLVNFDIDRAVADTEELRREEERLDDESNKVYAEADRLKRYRAELENGVGSEVVWQQRRNAEAELRQLARDWAALKIGELLLETALERQRAARKDPLLARASEFFSTLTGGVFAEIQQILNDKDEPVLGALRANGESLDVEGLSEGARDQLYLALRLAYVEDYASRSEPAPFIADDLFTSFDDARTGFALATLGGLGALAQPIVFTHHRHVVDIAKRVLGDAVDIIELA
jgi:uncharacterized protein YhaN